MLRGVTDPIKRAEAVNSIIKSVSVIPDQIVRATYLSDCSHRLGINEATLIASMNKMIRSDKEQRQREAERERERAAGTETAEAAPTTDATAGASQPMDPLSPATPLQQASMVEQMLIKVVIRHGEEIIYRDVATDDGNTVNLTVAQYISYDLGADGLSFSQPLFNQILDEATQHSGEPGFVAADYFVRHPDVGISKLAAEMVIDRVQLTKSLQMKREEGTLRSQVEHLVLDFRMDFVEHKLKELQKQIYASGGNMEQMMKLMAEYKDMQLIRNNMAKMLGTNIIV
jgi:DNA primase